MEDNKRKLYDALSQDYDMGTFEQFSSDIQDEGKRRKLYDATSEEYDYGDYESFSRQLGFGHESEAEAPKTRKTQAQPAQQQPQEPLEQAAPDIGQVKARKTFNVSRNPEQQAEMDALYQQAVTPRQGSVEHPVEQSVEQQPQAPARKRDFGVENYYQQGKEAAAQQPKPSVQTEKSTMERNLDAINQRLAEENFPEVEVGDEGKKYKIVGAAAVDEDGTLHLVAKGEDGKEVELTAKDYSDFMPDNSVEGRNRKQMEADMAEVERLNNVIDSRKGDRQNRKDEDFVGPVLDKRGSRDMRNDAEAELQRAMYRLDNNPEYQKMIQKGRQDIQNMYPELDEALKNSGGGTEGREIGEIVGDFNPVLSASDAGKMHNEQVYGAAARMLQDAEEIMGTGLRYKEDKTGQRAEFLKAAGKDMANPDFWTMGLTDIIDDMTFRDIMERYANQALAEFNGEEVKDPLSPIEEKLVEAYLTRAQAMALRSGDQSMGSKMGKGAAESLKFMIDMAVSGGLGKAVSKGAAEAFTKKAVAKFGRKLSQMATETGFQVAKKAAVKEAGSLGIKLAGDFIETVPKVALSPLTAQSVAEQAAQYDPETGFKSWGEAWGKGVPSAFIEKYSELHGGIYERAAKNVFKVSGAPTLYRKLVSEDLRKTFRDIAKSTNAGKTADFFAKGGFDGMWEMAEEMEGAAFHQLMGDENAWNDFWTRENWLEMAGSFAPMTVFGMGMNAGQRIHTERKFEKTLATLGEMGFNTDALRDVARTSTIKDLAAYLSEGVDAVQNRRLAGTAEGVALAAEDKKKTAEALSDFMKAAAQMQALDGLYQGEQETRMDAKKDEISQAVGGKQFWKEDGTVEIAHLANGEDVFVVSAPNRAGRVAVLHMDGTPGYISIDDLADEQVVQSQYGDELATGNEPTRKQGTVVMPLDEYLSLRIQTDRQNDEAARMETERQQQVSGVASQYRQGQRVQYQRTDGTKKKGQVLDTNDPDVLIIQNDDGTVEYVPWDEVAAWTGQTINVQTDDEQAQGVAGLLEAGDDAREQMYGAISGGFQPGDTVQGADGRNYKVMGLSKDSIDIEKGTARFWLEDSDGNLIDMDLPFADFIRNGAEKAAAAAKAEEERLAEEQRQLESERKLLEAGIKEKEDAAKKEEDRRKLEADPDRLIEEDPERFAELNDEQNKDGGADTRELFGAKIAENQQKIDELQKQRSASTKPSERKALADQIAGLTQKNDRMRKVLDSYGEKGPGEAPATPAPVEAPKPPKAPQGPSGHVLDLEAQRKRAQEQADKDFPKIQEKWNTANKKEGFSHTKNLPNGKKLRGHYVLTEAEAMTPSHDPFNGYKPSLGFPRVNGSTVNDRDYEHDKSARQHTEYIAGRYNGRALDDIPTVTPDGVVIDGNGRTMASQIAARNGSDTEYLETLREEAQRFGFSESDLDEFQHPRVVFVTDESVPYTVDAFAQFNDSGMKEQTMEGEAVKDGKILGKPENAEIVNSATGLIGQFDTVDQALRDEDTVKQIYDLFKKAGVFKDSDFNRMFLNGKMTDTGKERIKNALLGIAFDEDVIRLLLGGNMDAVKKKVLRSMAPIVKMRGFTDRTFDISGDISEAIRLINAAMQDRDPKSKDIIRDYMQRMELAFDDEGNAEQRAPQYSETAQVLANLILKYGEKKVADAIAQYVSDVAVQGEGAIDMFGSNLNAEDSIKNAIFEQTGQNYEPTVNAEEPAAPADTGAGSESPAAPQGGAAEGGSVSGRGSDTGAAEEQPGTGTESVEPETPAEEPEPQDKYSVLDDEIADLEKEIADKIKSQLNAGLDPTLLPLVGRLAIAYIERGAYKIADFAKKMVEKFGDAIRDYIAPAYAYARQAFRREKRMDIADRMDSADTIDNFDVDNFDKAPAAEQPAPAPTQEKPAEKTKAEKPKKAKKPTVESIFAETTGQEKPAEEGSDADFGGLFAQPIDNQQNNSKNSRISEKELLALRKKELGIDPSDYRTYMTPEAREFFETWDREHGSKMSKPHLAFVSFASRDGVIIPVEELEALPEIVEKEEKIKETGRKAKEETGSEQLILTPEEQQGYVDRLLSDENGSLAEDGSYSGPVAREKKAFIVIGRPAGGKSSVFADPLSRMHQARIVDSDIVKPWLKGYDGGDGANYVNAASAKVADEAMMQAAARGENLVIPKIGGKSSISEIALPLRLAGYTVELCFNEIPQENSIMRAAARFAEKGRYLSLQYLKSIGDKPLNTFKKFADKSIKESIDELSEKEVQELRRRSGRLSEMEGGQAGTGREAGDRGGQGTLDGVLQGTLGEGGTDGSLGLTGQDKLFSYSEWRNNDVAFGAEPILVWSSESGKPLPGTDQAKDAQKVAQKAFRDTVRDALLKAVETGQKPYPGIVQLRNAARDAGMEVDEKGATDSLIQEIVEDAIVRAARILNGDGLISGKSIRERYDSIVKLYEMQPPINQRSSGRIAKQQYSTPLPMGFVADMFGWQQGWKNKKTALEPTAGTGMMVFSLPAKAVTVNEIDPVRLDVLRGMNFAEVTDQDATQPFPEDRKYDIIIANPPFGSAAEPKTFDGVTFTKLEHIIALNALETMKPDGKAAIIVGGNMEYYPNGAIKTDAKFYHYLYDHFNVKGVVDMDGSLYAKQGTTYPTRMILIEGKRSEEDRAKERVYAPERGKAPRKAETFADLYDIVNEINKSEAKTNGNAVLRTEGQPAVPDNSNASGSTDLFGSQGESRPDGDNGGAEGSRDSGRRGSARNEGGNESAGSQQEGKPGVKLPVRPGLVPDVAETQPGPGNSENEQRGGNTAGTDREGGDAGNAGGSVSAEVLGTAPGVGPQRPQRVEEKRELSSDKLHYVQHSGAFSLESVAPAPMVEAMDESLKKIESEYGPIDEFVRKELGYPTREALYKALAAEQVDSVAMAIYQMKNGAAMIIGDQTGVGKGRQMAALIRWARRQGKKPIFVTQKAGLFSDMYRDLADIGSAGLVPFIFNADGDMTYEDKDGNLVVAYKHASDTLLKQAFEKGELPEGCDYAVITYSQVSSGDAQSRSEAKKNGGRSSKKKSAGKPSPKADFLRKIAKGNYILMDESHTAAGESNTGAYFQSLLKDAAGATFASATFAKRPDTMPLYALRTAMSQANVKPEELIASIMRGGVALQEIMSRALTQTGQMVRRERDMSDVVTDWITIEDPETVQRARENYDKTIEAFNGIIKFQEDYVRPTIEGIAGGMAATGGNATGQRGTEKLGIDNTPFASKTYNYTKQLMLALKAEAVVDKVIEEIKAGRHPVIALESTMESGLKDDGYSAGDTTRELTFASSLLRGLDSVMRYAIKTADGDVRPGVLTPEELGPAGEAEYYRLQQIIREFTAGVFASPLDLITMKLQDAGYKVGELTGRDLVVQRGENGGYVIAKRDSSNKAKKKAAADFNSGRLDVLILNKAASTGISLHASKSFKDQRQRTMILAQPMSDINDYMQMIGRIDRTGQVHRGYYINLALPVAAEQRFNMMLSTKLKSLNANTAADQEGGGSVEAVDLLNKYGDQVVVEYLRDHPDIYEKLGTNALKTSATGGRYVEPSELDEYTPKEGDARKITGRVALLSTTEQEAFYDDVIQRYNDLIQYLDDTGTNDLKITTLPLRAETISKKVSSKGVNPDGDNPFAKDAYVETVEMDNLRKPMKADEVKATIEKLNGGLYDGPKRVRQLTTRVTEDQARKTDAENERYQKALAKLQEDINKFTDKVNARKGQSAEDKIHDILEYTSEQTEKVEQKHKENLDKIGGQGASFRRRLEMFQVGVTYLVPDQLADDQMFVNSSPAIFCGFKVNESKMTPSTTFAVFAVLDGRRKVELKLSQPGPLERIRGHSSDNWGRTRQTTLENWDASYVNSARKKGHIMTGNILQAIKDTMDEYGNFPGQLVSYTDMEGNIHDGILMPDNWSPAQLRSSGVPVNTKIEDVLNGLDIVSADGKVQIDSYKHPYNKASTRIEIYVPKSKKEGAKYYENQDLIAVTQWGDGFNTYRGRMYAAVYGEENIRKALDILSGLGVRVADESEEEQDTTKQTRYRDASTGEDVRYRIREDQPPTNKGIGYKVFYLPKADKLDLYPPMVANPDGASTPTGLWLDADAAPVARTTVTGRQQVKAGGKGTQGGSGTLAYRPGWHLGEIPYAIQFNRMDESGEKTLFPKNFVWAEVEYAADVDYQEEAMSYGMKESGKFQHSLAGLPYLPKDGFYTYRTNPNPATDPWIITGSMRVKRLLTPSEVDEMVLAAGRTPQPRESGAITDEQINKLNEEIEHRSQIDPEVVDGYINDLAENLGVKVRIVRDVNEIADKDERTQRRKRRSKGYYDVKTGEIVLVLPNAANVADAEATVFHEGVGHKGLRELLGKSFDKFLDDVYRNAEPGMKARIDAMRDSAIKDKTEQTREAIEEYMAEMAERGVEDGLEMSFWERVKAKFRELARALGIRFKFTDADIRYNLWKSKRRLAKKGESVLEKADRVATDQELRRAAEASYAAKGTDEGYTPDGGPGGTRYRDGENPVQKEGENDYEFLKRSYDEIRRRYKPLTKYVVKVDSPGTKIAGSYMPEFDSIRIFAAPGTTFEGYLGTFFHENLHAFLDKKGSSGDSELARQFTELFRNILPECVTEIESNVEAEGYEGEDAVEEVFVLLAESVFMTGRAREFLDKVTLPSKQLLIDYLNAIEYGNRGNIERNTGAGSKDRVGTKDADNESGMRLEEGRGNPGGDENGGGGNRRKPINKARTSPSVDLSRSSRVLRDRAITNDTQDVALRMFGNEAMLARNIVREILVDQHTSVRTAMRAIEKETGREATAKEDITKALNQLSSKQQAASERYANNFLKPLMETVAKVADEMDVEFEDIIQYVCLRRALEVNELYAKRDAREYYQRKHDDAVLGIESRTDIDRAAKDRLIAQADADLQNQLNDTERGMSDKYRELRGTDGRHEGKDYGATVSWFSDYVDMYGNRSDTVPPREPGEDTQSYQRRLKGMRKPVAGAETLAGAEDLASQYIHDFETRAGGLSRELWDKINAATQEILRIQYDSHLVTREQYDDIRNRSQYYVPLRGFADMTAEDAFSYVTDDLSDTFVPALMRAGGRISKPDSPFGFIAGMAASTINEAYKNMAVQALYRFVANRKDNSLAVISDSWYVPTGRMVTMADVTAGDARLEDLGKEIWEPAYPDLSSPDMADQEASVQSFNADMERKAALGQAAKGTAGLNLRNSFVFNKKANEKQHFVRVKVLGQEKFIIFRGDPRAAQAINGILNPDTRDMSAWSRGVRATARTMAKLCTSYSVPFWFSNFFRDGQTAIINCYEKEGPEYTRKMLENIPFALGVIGAHVKGGEVHIKDNWSDARKRRVQRLYDEYQKYAAGGAITGYSVIFNHAEYDKQFKRAIREKKSELAEMWGWIGDTLEAIGTVSEGIEQVFRFATFITSREMGRPMEQCIDDAKNVTVNFNRKGSYAAMEWNDTARISTFDKKSGTYSTLGEKGGAAAAAERAFIWFLSQIAPWVRTRFMFVNPNIQGTYTTYSNFKISPLRTASAIFGVAMTSFLIHLVASLLAPDPDDRDREKKRKIPYSHLTDYQRRSNIVLPELGGVRVTIPLSQEYAPFWAIGDIMASAALKEKYDQKTAWEVAKALGEIAPVNAFDPTNIVPDPLRPALEAATNTNYQGRSIFQKLYNETSPDYKRAYNGTWTPLVDLSVALNKAMGGTESVTPEGYGKVANVPFRWNNPAAWQHVIEGMGGTTVSALGDVMELAGELAGPEDVKLGSVPIVNRFVKDPYEWGNDWYLNTEANKFKNLAAEQNKRRKALEKAGEMDALQRLLESDNWAITDLYDRQYKSDINRLEKKIRELKGSPDSRDKERLSMYQQDLEALQSALIKDVKNLLKDRK